MSTANLVTLPEMGQGHMDTRPRYTAAEIGLKDRLKYTDVGEKDLVILHRVNVGFDDYVEVFGDPSNASYEWLIRSTKEGVIQHSDCGYGGSTVCLRDGLIAYEGLPCTVRRALVSAEKYLVDRGIETRGTVGRTEVLPAIRRALAQFPS